MKPKPRIVSRFDKKLYLLISNLAGIAWIKIIIYSTIDILKFVQSLYGISDIFMGLSILAISNSAADLFVITSLSAQGHEVMAITGVITGQMFNFLIGFGTNCFLQWKRKGSDLFILFDLDELLHNRNQQKLLSIISSSLLVLVFIFIKMNFIK